MRISDNSQESAPYETIAYAALADVPLTPKQIESVLPRLFAGIDFIMGKSHLSKQSGFWDFRGKITATATRLGIDPKTYIEKATLKQPSLFYRSPETIDENITRAADLLHIDKKAYIKQASLKAPSLFYQSPETVDENITRAASLLEIDKKTFIEKVLKKPSLHNSKNFRGHSGLSMQKAKRLSCWCYLYD